MYIFDDFGRLHDKPVLLILLYSLSPTNIFHNIGSNRGKILLSCVWINFAKVDELEIPVSWLSLAQLLLRLVIIRTGGALRHTR